jgi:hypothetical protein
VRAQRREPVTDDAPLRAHSTDRMASIGASFGVDAPEITARFRDPGGNVIGLYQSPA